MNLSDTLCVLAAVFQQPASRAEGQTPALISAGCSSHPTCSLPGSS